MKCLGRLLLFVIASFLLGCAAPAPSVVSTEKEVKLEREQSYQDYIVRVFRVYENGASQDGHFEILKS